MKSLSHLQPMFLERWHAYMWTHSEEHLAALKELVGNTLLPTMHGKLRMIIETDLARHHHYIQAFKPEVEELMDEVFLHMFEHNEHGVRRIDLYDPARASFFTWASCIARTVGARMIHSQLKSPRIWAPGSSAYATDCEVESLVCSTDQTASLNAQLLLKHILKHWGSPVERAKLTLFYDFLLAGETLSGVGTRTQRMIAEHGDPYISQLMLAAHRAAHELEWPDESVDFEFLYGQLSSIACEDPGRPWLSQWGIRLAHSLRKVVAQHFHQ